jgi:hypothetical protein
VQEDPCAVPYWWIVVPVNTPPGIAKARGKPEQLRNEIRKIVVRNGGLLDEVLFEPTFFARGGTKNAYALVHVKDVRTTRKIARALEASEAVALMTPDEVLETKKRRR